MSDEFTAVASVHEITNKQRLFMRYFTAILVDLVVLNLFDEYWSYVTIDSFTVSLIAALLLQVLLQLTLVLEHKVAAYFNAKAGAAAKTMRIFCAWLILFLSKFVILEALYFFLGDNIVFGGPLNGVVALIAVVIAILAAEEAIIRFYRKLI
jgi:hypothetical protein